MSGDGSQQRNRMLDFKCLSRAQGSLAARQLAGTLENAARESKNATGTYQTRWLWELVQNACDSIAYSLNRKPVKIRIDADDERVIFEHDGEPFTADAICGLFFKFSEGKKNEQNTGRFGTGFMTSHVLSLVIHLQTDIWEDRNDGCKVELNAELVGLRAIMYRDTEGNNIRKGIDETLDSFRRCETSGRTRFTYPMRGDENTRRMSMEARTLGYKSFVLCVAEALVFAPRVSEIEFAYYDHKCKAVTMEGTEIDDINIDTSTFSIDGKTSKRTFVRVNMIQYSKLVTELYRKDGEDIERHTRINVMVEVDEDAKLIVRRSAKSPCLFLTYPLVGSEWVRISYILDSADLEPDTERTNIMLSTGGSDQVKINQEILVRSIPMFRRVLKHLSDNGYNAYWKLTDGVSSEMKENREFDYMWFNKSFIAPVRSVFEEFRIVTSSNGGAKIRIPDAKFPVGYVKRENGLPQMEQQNIDFYALVQRVYGDHTVDFKESFEWSDVIWTNTVSIRDLLEKETREKSEIDSDYLNELIKYTWTYHRHLLEEYPVIPDMKEVRRKYTPSLKLCDIVDPYLIDMLDEMKDSWTSDHVHTSVAGAMIGILEDHEDNVIQRIIQLNKDDKDHSYRLVRYVHGAEQDRRARMLWLTSELLGMHIDRVLLPEGNYRAELWEVCDNFLVQKMVERIENMRKDDIQRCITLLGEFVRFLQNEDELKDKMKIVPNRQNELHALRDLQRREGESIPEVLRDVFSKYFDCDISRKEIHYDIQDIINCDDVKVSLVKDHVDLIRNGFSSLSQRAKDEVVSVIISLIPRNKESDIHERQLSLYNLHARLFQDEAHGKCEIDYETEDLWSIPCRYFIYHKLKTHLEEKKTLHLFAHAHKWSDKVAIEVLNSCYKFVKEGDIVPNMLGNMKKSSDLESAYGIEDDVIDFITKIRKHNELKEIMMDKRIQHDSVKPFSFLRLRDEMDSALRLLEDDQKLRDSVEINDMIRKLNASNMTGKFLDNGKMSDDEALRFSCFTRICVANMSTAIEKLTQPLPFYRERCLWELIQNARDSCVGISRRLNVWIEVREDALIFRHDGEPFTSDSFLALMYKFSEGKENDRRSTGKFGTGFMITHLMSRVVHVECDVIKENEIIGSKFTIDRRGNDRGELIESINRTEKSKKELDHRFNHTQFTYDLSLDDDSTNVVKCSVDSVREHIAEVLIFTENIESVTVMENGVSERYTEGAKGEHVRSVICEKEGQKAEVRFVIASCTWTGQSSGTQGQTEMGLTCLVPINGDNNVVSHKTGASIFCSYPLVGSKHLTPMIMNSLDFEPNEERSNLYLRNGTSKIEGGVAKGCVNYVVLEKSVHCFRQIIQTCYNLGIGRLYTLCEGLKSLPNSDYIDKDTYQKYIELMRKTIEDEHVFKTSEGVYRAVDVSIPRYTVPSGCNDREQFKSRFYEAFVCWYPKPVIYEDSLEWSNILWSSVKGTIDTDTLTKFVSGKGSMKTIIDSFSISEDEAWKRMNTLITFLLEYDKGKLEELPLVPNQKGDFVKIDGVVAMSHTLPDEVIEMLTDLGSKWKDQHVHKLITSKPSMVIHGATEASHEVRKIGEKPENICKMMKYVLKDSVDRIRMNTYSRVLFQEACGNMTVELASDVLKPDLWDGPDRKMMVRMLKLIEDGNNIKAVPGNVNVQWLNDLLEFLQEKSIPIKDRKVVPNIKGVFCKINDLYTDNIIHPDLKRCLVQYANVECDAIVMHSEITAVEPSRCMTFDQHCSKLSQRMKSTSVNSDLLNILVKYTNDDDDETEQKKHADFLQAYNRLTGRNEKQVIMENFCTPTFRQTVMGSCARLAVEHISTLKSIKCISEKYNISETDICASLELMYESLVEGTILKAPNMNGVFSPLKDMKQCDRDRDGSMDILFDVGSRLQLSVDYRSIILHSRVRCKFVTERLTITEVASNIEQHVLNYFNEFIRGDEFSAADGREAYRKGVCALFKFFDANEANISKFPLIKSNRDTLLNNVVLTECQKCVLNTIGSMREEDQQLMASLSTDDIADMRRIQAMDAESRRLVSGLSRTDTGLIHMIRNLSPEVRQRIESMSPDEFMQNMLNIRQDAVPTPMRDEHPMHQERRQVRRDKHPMHQERGQVRRVQLHWRDFGNTRRIPDAIRPDVIDIEDGMEKERTDRYKGEAIVYEHLDGIGVFDEVIWKSQSESETDVSVTCGNMTFYITPNENPDAIYARLGHVEYQFIVKSSDDTDQFVDFNKDEWEVLSRPTAVRRTFLARVMGVNCDTPNVVYAEFIADSDIAAHFAATSFHT